jgi:uncharacterized protein YjbI with pentapeptide repeats
MSQLTRGSILDRLAVGESLRGVNLVRADLSSLDLPRIDLTDANMRMADLSRANLRESRLGGCFLSGATLNEANLASANMAAASLIGVALKNADLSGADLSGADLTGATLEGSILTGAYLVGTFLNETNLHNTNLSSAFIRMAQMSGSDLSGAILEGADLSQADLSGVRFDGCSLVGATLTGANLSASTLVRCDLRGADLTGVDLSGCDLTGAKLSGIKFSNVKLNDTWAEWIDLSTDGRTENRASLAQIFVGIISKPLGEILVEGRVSDDAWAIIISHICDFQASNPRHADVRLKAIHQGISSSVIYLEATSEASLAAYFGEFAEIMGKGSLELREKLDMVIAERGEEIVSARSFSSNGSSVYGFADIDSIEVVGIDEALSLDDPLDLKSVSHGESLQRTDFLGREKALAIISGNQRIWLEAASSESLTLRPPHGPAMGLDLIRGRFVTDDRRPPNKNTDEKYANSR